MSGVFCSTSIFDETILLANSVDPDQMQHYMVSDLGTDNVDPAQMPHDVASDLGLHCLPMTLLQVSR